MKKLDDTVRYYSQTAPRVNHGGSIGQLPRNLREINIELAKIKKHDCSMEEGLKNIIPFAQSMGKHHPILVAANKCYGLITNDIQSSLYQPSCRLSLKT